MWVREHFDIWYFLAVVEYPVLWNRMVGHKRLIPIEVIGAGSHSVALGIDLAPYCVDRVVFHISIIGTAFDAQEFVLVHVAPTLQMPHAGGHHSGF